MKSPNKRNPFAIFFAIFSILSLIVFAYLIYVVNFSQDAIDSRNGVPETGWGVVITMIILGPVLLLFVALSIMFLALYVARKRRNEKQALNQNMSKPSSITETPSNNQPPSVTS